MSIAVVAAEARKIDPASKSYGSLLRMSQWICLALIATAFLTTPEWENVHRMATFSIAALLISRIAWAVFEPRPAPRSGDRLQLNGMKQAVDRMRVPFHDAFHHAGSAIVIWLVAAALVISTAAIMLVTHKFTNLQSVEEMHEVLVYFTVGVVIAHVVGVVIASIEWREGQGR